jgi:Transposase domain (DUF772)
VTKVNCSTSFILATLSPKITWCGRSTTALDPSWLRNELAPHYSSMGRPSIDPELMIRMLVVGYVFAIRSERLICREVQVIAWTVLAQGRSYEARVEPEVA